MEFREYTNDREIRPLRSTAEIHALKTFQLVGGSAKKYYGVGDAGVNEYSPYVHKFKGTSLNGEGLMMVQQTLSADVCVKETCISIVETSGIDVPLKSAIVVVRIETDGF